MFQDLELLLDVDFKSAARNFFNFAVDYVLRQLAKGNYLGYSVTLGFRQMVK